MGWVGAAADNREVATDPSPTAPCPQLQATDEICSLKTSLPVRTRDSFYRDVLTFEKHLPAELVGSGYRELAIWSLIRMPVFERLSQFLVQGGPAVAGAGKVSLAGTAALILRSGIFSFLTGIFRGRNARVLIRVNSFSLTCERDGTIQFRNRNLQEIYDRLVRHGVKVLVIVSDLEGFRLQSRPTAALVYPGLLISAVRKLLGHGRMPGVNELARGYARSLPLDEQSLRTMILNALATYCIWSLLFRLLRPDVAYFESPHNSFEPEIAAAKHRSIRTVEIYHGVITQVEATYFQRHLDFGCLVHGVCDEYLSPSPKQTRYLARHSDKYSRISTLHYRSALRFSTRERLMLARKRYRPREGRTKVLIIAGLYDGAIADVMSFLRQNRSRLVAKGNKVSLRLHPADSRERWVAVAKAFPIVEFSTLPLAEDVAGANELVLGNTSVALQLHSLKVGFRCISAQELI